MQWIQPLCVRYFFSGRPRPRLVPRRLRRVLQRQPRRQQRQAPVLPRQSQSAHSGTGQHQQPITRQGSWQRRWVSHPIVPRHRVGKLPGKCPGRLTWEFCLRSEAFDFLATERNVKCAFIQLMYWHRLLKFSKKRFGPRYLHLDNYLSTMYLLQVFAAHGRKYCKELFGYTMYFAPSMCSKYLLPMAETIVKNCLAIPYIFAPSICCPWQKLL